MSSKLKNLQEKQGFYWFWAWEYTRRNEQFVQLRNEYETLSQGFSKPQKTEFGFEWTAEDHYAFDRSRGEDLSDEIKRAIERREEICAYLYAHYGYKLDFLDLCEKSSGEWLQRLIDGKDLKRPRLGRGRFTEMDVVELCECTDGVKELRWGNQTFHGYDALVAIDFSKDIGTLRLELEQLKTEYDDNHEILDTGKYKEYQARQAVSAIKKGKSRFTFRVDDAPRIAGLWMWDELVKRYGREWPHGSQEEIINLAEKRCSQIKSVSDNSSWRWLLSRTSQCIEQAKVLSFGKPKRSKMMN